MKVGPVVLLALLTMATTASAETRTRAVPGGSARACFPVSLEVWTAHFEDSGSHVIGWASIDPTARFEGLGCQVSGWAPIDPCGRTITAYLADCPDGAFTFTRTEADCNYVLGCGHRPAGTGSGAPR